MAPPPFRIVIAIYPGMTHLDFTGPHQVFARLPGAEVTVASATGGTVEADGLAFAGTTRLADIADCDLLLVPGGAVGQALAEPGYLPQIRRLGAGCRYLTSVCTGSLLLGAAGFLQGRRAACHWAYRHLLPTFGAIPDPARVVRDGRIITGGGVTAGIDFALTVAGELVGDEGAQAIQLTLEYAPQPPFDCGTPGTAPAEVLALVTERMAGRVQAAAEALGVLSMTSPPM